MSTKQKKAKPVEAWAVIGAYDYAVVKRRAEVPSVYENNPRIDIVRLVPYDSAKEAELRALRKRVKELEALAQSVAQAHIGLRFAEERAQKLAELGERARHLFIYDSAVSRAQKGRRK